MRSLQGRVALAAVAATAMALLLVGVVVVATFLRDQRSALDEDLRRRAEAAVGAADGSGSGSGPVSGGGSDAHGPFARRFEDGRVVAPGGLPPGFPGPQGRGPGSARTREGLWRTYVAEGADGATVQVAAEVSESRRAGRALARRLFVVGLGALGLVGAASWTLSGLALRPLGRLRTTAERVASTRDLDTRLPDEGPEEVAALAGSLNAMLGRLQTSADRTEAALEANRRFAADAGHELRTPLTSLTANLDVLAGAGAGAGGGGVAGPGAGVGVGSDRGLQPEERARAVADARRETARLVTLLDALQALARGDSSSIRIEPLDVADVVDRAVAAVRSRHPDSTIQFADPGEVPLEGWAEGLRLAVENLLENAARHGGPTVVVTVAATGAGAEVVVDDDGSGIPAADRGRVFERFARGATAAPGSGLGLALVAQQAALHGGAARVDDGPLGGARVTLSLAAAPSWRT